MIVNIPLQIDEQKMEEVIAKDYQNKVYGEIAKYIKTTLINQSDRYFGNREQNGMKELIKERIDIYLEQHSDEIINAASKALADKLARSKRGKAILDEVSGQTV